MTNRILGSTMKTTITSDSGVAIPVHITGSVGNPIIVADPFFAPGNLNEIGGVATLEHWEDRGLEPGLFFQSGEKAYIQCENEHERIQQIIGNL